MILPELCNKTVTLFCCVSKNEQTKYYKYTLNNCFINQNASYIKNRTGVEQSTNCLLVIPYQSNYVDKSEWMLMSEVERKIYWTVGVSDKDFYIDGDIPEIIPPNKEHDVKKKYRSYLVKKVDVKPNFDGGVHRIVVQGE